MELLIASVRSQKVVWDSSCNGHKSKNSLDSAWVQIAIDCGLEGNASHVKAKWRDLKDTYRRKFKMLTPKSGDARGAKKVCWQWINKMSFMRSSALWKLQQPPTS